MPLPSSTTPPAARPTSLSDAVSGPVLSSVEGVVHDANGPVAGATVRVRATDGQGQGQGLPLLDGPRVPEWRGVGDPEEERSRRILRRTAGHSLRQNPARVVDGGHPHRRLLEPDARAERQGGWPSGRGERMRSSSSPPTAPRPTTCGASPLTARISAASRPTAARQLTSSPPGHPTAWSPDSLP